MPPSETPHIFMGSKWAKRPWFTATTGTYLTEFHQIMPLPADRLGSPQDDSFRFRKPALHNATAITLSHFRCNCTHAELVETVGASQLTINRILNWAVPDWKLLVNSSTPLPPQHRPVRRLYYLRDNRMHSKPPRLSIYHQSLRQPHLLSRKQLVASQCQHPLVHGQH